MAAAKRKTTTRKPVARKSMTVARMSSKSSEAARLDRIEAAVVALAHGNPANALRALAGADERHGGIEAEVAIS